MITDAKQNSLEYPFSSKEGKIIKQTYERIMEVVSDDVLVEIEYGYGSEYGYGEMPNTVTFHFTFGNFHHFVKIIKESDLYNNYIKSYCHYKKVKTDELYKVLAMDILESFKNAIINKIFNIDEMYRYDNPF